MLSNGLLIEVLSFGSIAANDCSRSGEQAEVSRGWRNGGQLGQPINLTFRSVVLTRAVRCLHHVGKCELELRGVVGVGAYVFVRLPIVAQPELEDAACVVGKHELVALPLASGLGGNDGAQRICLL